MYFIFSIEISEEMSVGNIYGILFVTIGYSYLFFYEYHGGWGWKYEAGGREKGCAVGVGISMEALDIC